MNEEALRDLVKKFREREDKYFESSVSMTIGRALGTKRCADELEALINEMYGRTA